MRLALKIVMGLFTIVLLLAAVMLVPAHLQTLRLEPPLPGEAKLRALLSIENGPVSVRYLITSSQQAPDVLLGHSVFLIEWADGKLFMIDAGMDRATAAEFSSLMEFVMGPSIAEIHGNIAELLDDDVRRVAGVGFTHLHIDHSQGLLPFCEARGEGARLYQTPWQAELHNFNTEEGATIAAQSCSQRG
jgi:glyoxylase-like metal-dependent hydrolase (beta-lactamase superfamily II)